MTLPAIVRKSLRQHALSTVIALLSMALACGLWLTVWMLKDQARQTFTGANAGFDAVLGARGSKLQLVLNAVFHVDASPGNLRWNDYLEVQSHPQVALAVPLAVGDNYRGYRLVGTVLDLFQQAQPAPNRAFALRPGGRFFSPDRREAVVGSFVAQRLGLRVGDTFRPYHGLHYDEEEEHEETYVVVGLLEPTNTPADRVIWIPLAGLQQMSGHDPAAATDLSAVLIKFKPGAVQAGFLLDRKYNRQGERLTLAWPIAQVVAQLFDRLNWLDRTLELIAYLVAGVATGSVLASLYNSMNERRREIAILRALGARRATVFYAVVLEAVSIALAGVLLGGLVYAGLFTTVATVLRTQTGVVLDVWHPSLVLLVVPLVMVALGALAGILPAFKAYRTHVAEHLQPS